MANEEMLPQLAGKNCMCLRRKIGAQCQREIRLARGQVRMYARLRCAAGEVWMLRQQQAIAIQDLRRLQNFAVLIRRHVGQPKRICKHGDCCGDRSTMSTCIADRPRSISNILTNISRSQLSDQDSSDLCFLECMAKRRDGHGQSRAAVILDSAHVTARSLTS
jgi:hypothetical protein